MLQANSRMSITFDELREKIKFHKKHHHHVFMMFRLMNKNKLSPAEGQVFFLLRNKYEKAYVQLLKELDPFRYEVYLEEKSILSGKAYLH